MIAPFRRRLSALVARFPILSAFLKNASWLYTANLYTQLVSFILTIYIATKFDPADYGRVGVVIAYCVTVNTIIDFRIWETVINFYGAHIERNEIRRARSALSLCLGIDFGTGVIGLLVVLVTATWAAETFLQNRELAVFFQIYGIALFLKTIHGSTNAMLWVHDRFRWLGIMGILVATIRGIVTVLFLTMEVSLMSIFLANVVVEIARAALLYPVAFYVSYRYMGRAEEASDQESTGIDRSEVWSIIKFSVGTNLFGTLRHISENSTILIMGVLASDAVIGLFRLATNLINVATQLRTPLQMVVYPDIVKAVANDDKKQLYRVLRSATVLGVAIPGSVCIGMIFFMGPVLNLTPVRREYLDAIPYMQIMLIGSIARRRAFLLAVTGGDRRPILLRR